MTNCVSDLTVSETVIIVSETMITVTENHFAKIVRSAQILLLIVVNIWPRVTNIYDKGAHRQA